MANPWLTDKTRLHIGKLEFGEVYLGTLRPGERFIFHGITGEVLEVCSGSVLVEWGGVGQRRESKAIDRKTGENKSRSIAVPLESQHWSLETSVVKCDV